MILFPWLVLKGNQHKTVRLKYVGFLKEDGWQKSLP